MLEYSDISTYVDQGKTAAEIAVILTSDMRHKNDIMATSITADETDLLDLLGSTFKVLRLTKDATWTGSLVDYFDANPSSPLKEGFELLLTQLQISNRPVRCGTDPVIGALTYGITQVVAGLVDADTSSYVAQDVIDAMNDITGGLLYAGVTEADVQQVIDDKTAKDAADSLQATRDAIVNSAIAPIKLSWSNALTKLNNASASLSDPNIRDLTNEELQAKADAVLASEDGVA